MADTWADLFGLLDRIQREYPELAYLLDNDEVGPLLLRAVSGAMDTNEFRYKLRQTNWWKTTSEPARKWDAFANVDPATAKAQIRQQRDGIGATAKAMGVDLSLQGRHWIAVTAKGSSGSSALVLISASGWFATRTFTPVSAPPVSSMPLL